MLAKKQLNKDKQEEKDSPKDEKSEKDDSQQTPPPSTQMSPQQLKNLLIGFTPIAMNQIV